MEVASNVSRVKKIEGRYSFQIEGFSGISQFVTDCVESPEFSLCGHTWQLRLFPGGSLAAHKDYLSFYLASKSDRVARASYKLTVVNQILGLENETFCSSAIRVFEANRTQVDGWGRDKFMDKSLQYLINPGSGFCVDDCITFRVEITVFGDLEPVRYCSVKDLDTNLLYNTLGQCFRNMLVFPVLSDITICVGEDSKDRIFAHKCVLMARSPVFFAMFSQDMQETCTGEVHISDFDIAIVHEMVHFIYTDSLSKPDTIVSQQDLLCIASKYQVSGLIALCEQYFVTELQVTSVIHLLQMANDYGAAHLKLTCLQYIASKPADIVQQQCFHELEDSLKKDVVLLINAVGKKRGCKSAWNSISSEADRKRSYNSCQIM